jgi:2,3-dihydroxyphenylpropionate 1,2-dioxygenase
MPLALCCMSHSPLLEITEQAPELESDVRGALSAASDFVDQWDPDVVVIFSPDHYNGFFYQLMPQFCIGTTADTVGDYGTQAGALDVPDDLARSLAESVLAAGVDLAVSHRMRLDHGTAQPLQLLLGRIDARPVIPIFVNAAAHPQAPLVRARLLGDAVGRFFANSPQRVLLVGSGGLSHDPPVPTLDTAPEAVADRLISGRELTADELERKYAATIQAAENLAAGTSDRLDLNPEWDKALLDLLARGDLAALDGWSNADIAVNGSGAQEIRTWVAAYGALAAAGSYELTYRYYRPIPEYIAGFAVTTALPVGRADHALSTSES